MKETIIRIVQVVACFCVLLLATIIYSIENQPKQEIPATTQIRRDEEFEEMLDMIRVPRGFSNTEAVVKFALENNIIDTEYYMNDEITIADLCEMIRGLREYYPELPDGFDGDKVKREDVDTSVVSQSLRNKEDIIYCLKNGYITTEQAKNALDTITLNEFTRITYHIGLNVLPYEKPTKEQIEIALENINNVVTLDAPECRLAKITFLNKYDLIPFTYRGDFEMDRVVTKQDALHMLIELMDTITIYNPDSKDENAGCAPCMDAAIVLERNKYNEDKG